MNSGAGGSQSGCGSSPQLSQHPPHAATPFLRVIPVTAAQGGPPSATFEPAAHDGYDGAGHGYGHDHGAGHSSLSPPPPDGGSATTKPKRKRSMIACKNCNERRVRCDGSTIGLPCSNCQHAGKTDCQFIESRRVRGAHGRFESRDGGTPTSGRSPAPPLPPRRQRRHSITGTDGDEWRRLLQNSVSASRTTTGPVTYLGESWHFSWVLLGEPDATESRPLHLPTLVMEDEESVSNRVNKELWDKGAYVLPRPETRDLLIVEYFERCHPVYPIVQKNVFMNSLRANAFSHLLLQSVLVVAATHCDLGILQRAGYVTRQEAVGAFYNRARVLFDGDVEPDKITNIQSIFLLQFWWRSVTDHKDTLWWLAGAIRLAQTMGLHRSTSRSRLGPEDRRLWRRIWWLLFLRDRQTASHLGKPMLISEGDCDVEELEIEDFDENMDTVQRISVMEHVKLAKLVGSIVECEFSPGSKKTPEERMRCRDECHTRLQAWQKALPVEIIYHPKSKNFYAMTLQMAFLAQLLLLNRPVIYKNPALPENIRRTSEKIACKVAEAITNITDDIMTEWGGRFMTQHCVSCLFSAMTVQIVNRRSLDPQMAADADTKLRKNLVYVEQLAKILPLSAWIHKRYLRVLMQQGEDEVRKQPISPPALVETPPPIPATLPPPPVTAHVPNAQMTTIPEEASATVALTESWTQDCSPLVSLEQTLSVGGMSAMGVPQRAPNISSTPVLDVRNGSTVYTPVAQSLSGVQGDGMPVVGYEYRWVLDNIGDLGNPFWWAHEQPGFPKPEQ